jgi:LmbE family N-acetylglucosaminyl deacetylase
MLTAPAEVWPSRRLLKIILVAAFLCTSVFAQAPARSTPTKPIAGEDPSAYLAPLPQDTGTAGLKQDLRRLQNTGRLMMVTAHPDDEDGGVLTLEARGHGVHTLLMTLTRGEGGQNELGTGLFGTLGIIRTLELLASDRYYGVEQRFSRVADFGFSKTAEETLQKWGGADFPLADLVRVIRTFRPDVLVARFSGTPRDGHGHHQASAILTKEAFRAAGDPNRFSDQIKEGLQPWQPKKLYIGNVCGFRSNTCADENWTVRFDTGEVDPVLGMSYLQMAMNGLAHQRTQGHFGFTVPPGPHYSFYKLVDSVVPKTTDAKGHEKDFFDGIDTSLQGLVQKPGNLTSGSAMPGVSEQVRTDLEKAQKELASAAQMATPSLTSLLDAQRAIRDAETQLIKTLGIRDRDPVPVYHSSSEPMQRLALESSELESAIRDTAGISFTLRMDQASDPNGAPAVIPNQSFDVTAKVTSSAKVPVERIALELPPGWKSTVVNKTKSDNGQTVTFRLIVPDDPQLTRPYWHRDNPLRESVNTIDDARFATIPFAPPPVQARADYTLKKKAEHAYAVGMATVHEPDGHVIEQPIAVLPAFSVALKPGEQVLPVSSTAPIVVDSQVSAANGRALSGIIRLDAPSGWAVEPPDHSLAPIANSGEDAFRFDVKPAKRSDSRVELRAVLDANGKKYSENFTLLGRDDIGSYYYYRPAVQHVSMVDVKVPKDLKAVYIQGAGEDTPTVLQQVGMNVTVLPAEKLATEDLSRYGSIVLGVRAYDAQKDVVANNAKLLKFVEDGGTLVVEHNNNTYDFNKGHFTPYPAELGRARVAVEEAPVQILAPENPVFHYPNEITEKDFGGWVQERGLYFMSSWDDHFTPLLACHDPNEPEQKGGLLMAKYGKGIYIYSGYSFYREVPAGVPGAVRLFVNLVSAGHQTARSLSVLSSRLSGER